MTSSGSTPEGQGTYGVKRGGLMRCCLESLDLAMAERVERAEGAIRAALRSDLALTDEPREALACRDSVMNALRAVLSEQEGQ